MTAEDVRAELWASPGGRLLREVLPAWRARLSTRLAGQLDALLEEDLGGIVGRLDRWILATRPNIDTRSEEGRAALDERVLDFFRDHRDGTVREIGEGRGATDLHVRESLHRLVERRAVNWSQGRYRLHTQGAKPGYAGFEDPGRAARDALDRLLLAALRARPEATRDQLWVELPGSQVQLRASLGRLIHRGAVTWTKGRAGVIHYSPEGVDNVR